MKKIIEDLGGVFDSDDELNKQSEIKPNEETYTIYIQFDNDPAVPMVKIPIGQELLLRIKEPNDKLQTLSFIDNNTKKKLIIFARKK